MKLSVRQAAAVLGVPETRVYHWVDADEIPFVMLDQQPRFHRLELLEWAMENELPLTVDLYETAADRPLTAALERGGGHAHAGPLPGVADYLPIADERERARVRAVLGARAPIAFVHRHEVGIALQRPSSPLICSDSPASVTLYWCDPAVPLGDKAATTLFLIVTPTTEQHLQLLSRLSLALYDGALRAAAVRKDGFSELCAQVRRWEATASEQMP
ncbi:MAG TPA: helix-turn-helix domain-containing protein [Kofleriaceae bacterium]